MKKVVQLTAIAIATDEFLEAVRENSSDPEKLIDEFAERYPDIGENIQDLFPALVGLEKIANAPVNPHSFHSPKKFPHFQDYEVIREIGRGGMGIVYEAKQKSLDRKVALKTLNLDTSAGKGFLERFQREAQIAATLHHSNIVPVFEVGCENGVHFFSMQYIDGISLADWRRHHQETQNFEAVRSPNPAGQSLPDLSTAKMNRSPGSDTATKVNVERSSDKPYSHPPKFSDQLDQTQIAAMGAEIADALSYIHQQGIIHRDIKPANILLDRDGKAWLADWGLAKSGFSDLTQTGELFGSLWYMAPERFKGESAATSDIYSLGATLYELLTMNRMFETEDHARLIQQIINDSPAAPSSHQSSITKDFENVILKSIDKDASQRYQTSAQFSDDLKNIVIGRPVSARRLNFLQRLVHWCSSNPLVASLVTAVALSLAIGITISTMLAISESKSRKLAEQREEQSNEAIDVFFGTFFPRSGPDRGAAMEPALRLAMDDAVAEIMDDPDYDAVVVGKLFLKLGWIYFNQQDYEKSLEVFQHAYDRISQEHGEQHENAMTALDHVGMTLMRLDRKVESEEALLKAWQLQAEHFGFQHENTIHSYAKLGDLYTRMGYFDEAIKITEHVLALRSDPNRNDHPFVKTSKNGLALAYIQKEQPEKAIELYEQIIQERESNNDFGIGLSYNLHNCAQAYHIAGKFDQALDRVQRSLQIREPVLSPNSESVLSSRVLKAAIICEQGNLAEALQQFETIWDLAESTNFKFTKGMLLLEWGLCLEKMEYGEMAVEKLTQARELLVQTRTDRNYFSRLAQDALDRIGR